MCQSLKQKLAFEKCLNQNKKIFESEEKMFESEKKFESDVTNTKY
jgi:hypothetical protein